MVMSLLLTIGVLSIMDASGRVMPVTSASLFGASSLMHDDSERAMQRIKNSEKIVFLLIIKKILSVKTV